MRYVINMQIRPIQANTPTAGWAQSILDMFTDDGKTVLDGRVIRDHIVKLHDANPWPLSRAVGRMVNEGMLEVIRGGEGTWNRRYRITDYGREWEPGRKIRDRPEGKTVPGQIMAHRMLAIAPPGVVQELGKLASVIGQNPAAIKKQLDRAVDSGFVVEVQGGWVVLPKDQWPVDGDGNGKTPAKALPLARKLASLDRPVRINNGGSDVWAAWRWLRLNGFAESYIKLTDAGREWVANGGEFE